MLDNLITIIYQSLDNGALWLDEIFSSFGLSLITVFVGLASIMALMKFVVSPYLTGSSDNAKNSKGKGKKG